MIELDKDKCYVVAVSTGVDSMVLLDMLMKKKINIVVAHVNHNKREESKKEEQFLQNFCKENKIKYEIAHFKHIDENFQAEARKFRYEFFTKVAKKHNSQVILTAHHSIDNVESILINILRGSNLKGYSGIADHSNENLEIIRPLLKFSKNDLYEYAHNMNITYFEDSSNQDDDYLRNQLRHTVIKDLELVSKDYYKKFNQYSQTLKESFDFIRFMSKSYIIDSKVDLKVFQTLHIALQKDILNVLFENYSLNSSLNKINDCIRVLENDSPNLEYSISKNVKLIKTYSDFYLSESNFSPVNITLNKDAKVKVLNYQFYFSTELPKKGLNFIKICYNIDNYPFTIRNKLPGDKIRIKNGHKKVSDFFKDLKLTKEQRDQALIVVNNKNEILWIVDYYKHNENGDTFLVLLEGEGDE